MPLYVCGRRYYLYLWAIKENFLITVLIKPHLSHFTQDSNFSTYQRMWSFMESARPTVFSTTNKEGEERVVRGKGAYAYLMESTTIEYVVERNCDLTQVGGMLDSKGYGIAMPPSKYCIFYINNF